MDRFLSDQLRWKHLKWNGHGGLSLINNSSCVRFMSLRLHHRSPSLRPTPPQDTLGRRPFRLSKRQCKQVFFLLLLRMVKELPSDKEPSQHVRGPRKRRQLSSNSGCCSDAAEAPQRTRRRMCWKYFSLRRVHMSARQQWGERLGFEQDGLLVCLVIIALICKNNNNNDNNLPTEWISQEQNPSPATSVMPLSYTKESRLSRFSPLLMSALIKFIFGGLYWHK